MARIAETELDRSSHCPDGVLPTCSIDRVNIAHMWRIGFDINAGWSSVLSYIDLDKPLSKYAAPGHWNDPDMLEAGKGMSADEDRSHFGLRAKLAAPLLTGNDIRSMNATTKGHPGQRGRSRRGPGSSRGASHGLGNEYACRRMAQPFGGGGINDGSMEHDRRFDRRYHRARPVEPAGPRLFHWFLHAISVPKHGVVRL